MSRIDEARARLAAGLATAQQIETQGAVQRNEQAEAQELQKENATKEVAAALEKNKVRQIADDEALSVEDRLKKIAEYVTAKDEDYETAEARRNEFILYFTYVQNQAAEIDLKGMQNLKEELQQQAKATVDKIVQELTGLQGSVAEADQLLDVAAKARAQGKTLAEIIRAIKQNDAVKLNLDKIEREIASLEQTKISLDADEKVKMTEQAAALDAMAANNKKWFKSKDTTSAIASLVTSATAALESVQSQIKLNGSSLTDKRASLEELQASYDKDLAADGSLAILRTMEINEDDINQNIIRSADAADRLVRGNMALVTQLIDRAAKSAERARGLQSEIDRTEQRAVILQGAIHMAANATTEQGATIKGRLDEIDGKIEGIDPSDPTKVAALSVLKSNRIMVAQKYAAAQAYEQQLGETTNDFTVLAGETADAKARAIQLAEFVSQLRRNFQALNTTALPGLARQLHLQLTVQHAQATDAIGAAVNSFVAAGRDITRQQLERLQATQKALHKQEVDGLNRLTEAVESANTTLGEVGNTMVDQGLEKRLATSQLAGATKTLSATLASLQDIAKTISAPNTDEAPSPGAATPRVAQAAKPAA